MLIRNRRPRSRLGFTFGIVALTLAFVAPAYADSIQSGQGREVTPSGNAPSPAPTASTAARPTPSDRYDPIAAGLMSRPPASQTHQPQPLAPPLPQFSFAGEDIATCCLRPPDTHGAVG